MEHQDWEQYIVHCKGSDKNDNKDDKNNKKEKSNTGVNEFLKDNKLEKKHNCLDSRKWKSWIGNWLCVLGWAVNLSSIRILKI